MKTIITICVGVALAGCVSADRSGDEDFNRYVEFCRETAMTPVGIEEPNDPISKIDWMVGASITTQEFNKEYKIVYADRDYLIPRNIPILEGHMETRPFVSGRSAVQLAGY